MNIHFQHCPENVLKYSKDVSLQWNASLFFSYFRCPFTELWHYIYPVQDNDGCITLKEWTDRWTTAFQFSARYAQARFEVCLVICLFVDLMYFVSLSVCLSVCLFVCLYPLCFSFSLTSHCFNFRCFFLTAFDLLLYFRMSSIIH